MRPTPLSEECGDMVKVSNCKFSRENLSGLSKQTRAFEGYIAVAGGEKNRYLPGKQYRILRKGKAVICA